MNLAPNPVKRRRSSSPGGGPGGGSGMSVRTSVSPTSSLRSSHIPDPAHSPSRPILPPPLPSNPGMSTSQSLHTLPHIGLVAPAGAGPSNWQQAQTQAQGQAQPSGLHWRELPPRPASSNDRERDREFRDLKRRSMDARSVASEIGSPKMEGIEEEGESRLERPYAREVQSRAPRSMMACTRCRRQKMKCDGPAQVPCRGCRQAGVPCVFEARTRPKSISAIPSRPPPFFQGTMSAAVTRSGSPSLAPPIASNTNAAPFYSTTQPPLTRIGEPAPEYALRQAREPMPPPQAANISVLTQAPYPTPTSAPRAATPPTQISVLAPPPGPGPLAGPPSAYPSVIAPHPSGSGPGPPTSSGASANTDARLNNIESLLQSLTPLPSRISQLLLSVSDVQRTTSSISTRLPPPSGGSEPRRIRARETAIQVGEDVWESYRVRAWPLTPWLVGLRDVQSLPMLVANLLGKRTLILADRSPPSRRDCDEASEAVSAEIGRLVADRVTWTREEIRALGVFATWVNDPSLAALAVAQARTVGLHRVFQARRTHDDWREWIYIAIMDQMCHLPNFEPPVTTDTLSLAWRDRLSQTALVDPAARDRDLKLLAHLEYAEILCEVHKAQQAIRSGPPASPAETETDVLPAPGRPDSRRSMRGEQVSPAQVSQMRDQEVRRVTRPWRRWAGRWDAWASAWNARNDPIFSLYLHFAILYTSSLCYLASPSIFADLATLPDHLPQLERSRDAALALAQAICTPQISPTLTYSFVLYRPMLGLALLHLISLVNSPAGGYAAISPSHAVSVLRQAHDALQAAQPLDLPGSSPRQGGGAVSGWGGGLVEEIVETGQIQRGAELVGFEPGKEAWARLFGT